MSYTILKCHTHPIVGHFSSLEVGTLAEAQRYADVNRPYLYDLKIVETQALEEALATGDRTAIKAVPNLDVKR